ASFRCQLEALSTRFRVVAWDAPGYGASTPLAIEHPDAGNYAAALDAWLGALGVDRCHLVGQSLGTLIAARFAAAQPGRVLSRSEERRVGRECERREEADAYQKKQ